MERHNALKLQHFQFHFTSAPVSEFPIFSFTIKKCKEEVWKIASSLPSLHPVPPPSCLFVFGPFQRSLTGGLTCTQCSELNGRNTDACSPARISKASFLQHTWRKTQGSPTAGSGKGFIFCTMHCRVSPQHLSQVLICRGNVDGIEVAGITLYLPAPLNICATVRLCLRVHRIYEGLQQLAGVRARTRSGLTLRVIVIEKGASAEGPQLQWRQEWLQR